MINFSRYKSLINKISKSEELEDIDEIEAIQAYLRRNMIDRQGKQFERVK